MYKYTNNNLLQKPITYQFSDVSSNDFIEEYKIQRKLFLKNIESRILSQLNDFIGLIQKIDYKELLRLQKKFEVKKYFYEKEEDNISLLVLFSYQLLLEFKSDFCYSLFSTFLKINDTLSSLPLNKFSSFELSILKYILIEELNITEELEND
jgi:hypothetical protein